MPFRGFVVTRDQTTAVGDLWRRARRTCGLVPGTRSSTTGARLTSCLAARPRRRRSACAHQPAAHSVPLVPARDRRCVVCCR
eukprot:2351823-Prymnesium_polylepis.1